MTRYSRYNIVYRMQKWMDSVMGQTFLNYAYSWGASIVILGTLFKLTHLPGANVMLFIGMGTEVCVFFISAFDRPFDKTAEGREMTVHAESEETVNNTVNQVVQPVSVSKDVVKERVINTRQQTITPAEQPVVAPQQTDIPQITQQHPGETWIIQQQEATPEMAEAQSKYIDELAKLTETLGKVSEQSVRLTRDSEEMENLNRTLTGISKVYEVQLKSASQQIGTIEQINEQSRRMAEHIEQLNKIYTRMIEAMTVNMRVSAPGITPNTNE